MMKRSTRFGRGVAPLPRVALVAGIVALPLGACSGLLDVTDPDVTTLQSFQDVTALPALRAAALGEFSLAFVGAPGAGSVQDGQLLFGGLLGDEWISSGTFPTRVEIDIRSIDEANATLAGATRRLYRARSAADLAVDKFAELAPNTVGHAEVLNLSALGFMFFGENYCSGVPFSQLNPDGSFTFGDRETTEQIFTRALDRANEAIAVATEAGAGDQLALAQVLKGRALLNLGRFAEAGAAVADVPTVFVYLAERSSNSPREENGTYTANVLSERYSAADTEGGNGLPYRQNFTAGDKRTPWNRTIDRITEAGDTLLDRGFDRVTAQYNQLKYLNRDADVPAASGLEARLIEAEAALQAGDMGTLLAQLNEQRTAQGIDPLTAADVPADMAGRVNLLFAERGYTLWLTSHRLGDMRRLIRQYGRNAETVFPTGKYHKNTQGGVYGTDVNLPVSVDERNNPNDVGLPEGQLCLDRNA